MAELNFGLLTPPGSQNIGNAFVQGMDQAAVARARENQNALSQYTLSKARREDELTNQLLGDLRNAKTPEEIYNAYRRVGKPEVASKMQSEALTQDELRGKILAQPGARARTDAETAKLQSEARSKAIAEVASLPDAASANAAIDTRLANKTIDQSMADEMRQGLTPENFPTWKHTTLMRLSTPVEQLKQSVVTTKDTDRGGFIERQAYNAQGVAVGAPTIIPKTPTPGSVPGIAQADIARARAVDEGIIPSGAAPAPAASPRITPQVPAERNAQQIVAPGGDPLRPAPVVNNMPGAPAPVVNAMTAPPPAVAPTAYSPKMLRDMALKGMQPDGKGGQTFIPGGEKDPAVEQQVAKARAVGAQAGKNDAIALEKLPAAIATGTELIRKLDALLGDANVVGGKVTFNKQAPAKGFETAFGPTGIAARAYPGSEAADFQAKVKEILGGAFLDAYETLRGAQAITDVEGKKATESRTRISFDLSPAEFINAAREYRKTAAEALGRSETRLKSLKSSSAAPANRPPLADIMSGN
jgi:hypothetical protein